MTLFIIFGTHGVTMTKERGEFHCPHCDARNPFRHRRVRRFFTLYFIPLIPLDLVGEYIECGRCKGTYEMAVLQYDPGATSAEFDAQFQRAVKRTMVMMMLADGVIDDEEIATIQRLYTSVAGQELSDKQVQEEIEAAQRSRRSLVEQLSELAGGLNDEGKEIVVQAAYYVAMADGELQDEEAELLGSIGNALGMSPAHCRGAIDAFSANA